MNQATINQNQSKLDAIPLLICPYCRKNIPRIYLRRWNEEMKIIVNCSCLNESKEVSLKQFMNDLSYKKDEATLCLSHSKKKEQYCIKCSSWLCQECLIHHIDMSSDHVLCEYEVSIQCHKDNKPFVYYCEQCQSNNCLDCVDDHLIHLLIPLLLPKYEEPKLSSFNDIAAKHRRLTLSLIKRLEAPTMNLMKNNLQSACDANEETNFNLITLNQSLYKTLLGLKSFPSYELMRQQPIIINSCDYIGCGESIEEEYEKFKQHLSNCFCLRLSSSNDCISTLSGHSQWVSCLVLLTDERLASCSFDKTINIWNTTTNKCLTTLIGHSESINFLIQLNNGTIASGSDDKSIKLWNITNNNECIASLIGHTDTIYYLIQLDNSRLASASGDKTIKLWNLLTYDCIATIEAHNSYVYCLVKLSNGIIASGSVDMKIKIWSTTTYECISTLTGHSDSVSCIILLTDGNLASASSDTTIKLWNASNNNKYIATLTGHNNYVHFLMQLSDGRLASASGDKTIKIWNLQSKECEITLIGHGRSVHCLAQLRNGLLASGSGDKTIKIWDI